MFEAHDALLVDDKGFRHAVNTPVDAGAPFGVEGRSQIGVAEVIQPGQAISALVLVIEAVNRQQTPLGQRHQLRMLLAAGNAPTGPDIEHPDLAEQVFALEFAFGVVEPGQSQRRGNLAEQGTWHFTRIQAQPAPQHDHQDQKNRQRQQQLPLFHRTAAFSVMGASAAAVSALLRR